MTDIKSFAERSKNMSKIRGKDTSPEIFIRHLLYKTGFRYYKNDNKVFGSPDIFIKKYKVAIFIHGCFWHRHANCKNTTWPKTNSEFWENKFVRNQQRDMEVRNCLFVQKIRVIIVWECTVDSMMKNISNRESVINEISSFIKEKNENYLEL